MPVERVKRWRRWVLWLAALGLLAGWSLTWALDSPLRPFLAERDHIRAAAVHVGGVACGRVSEGDGFAVEPGLVVTNAHVVAGVEEIRVTTPDGNSALGSLVGFDPARDIAAIAVPDLDVPPVALAPSVAAAGDEGDVAAVDSDMGLEFIPFEVSRRIWVRGRDIYGEQADDRQALAIRSHLAPGDSGAALVNADGDVWAMAFAVEGGRRAQGYALDLVEILDFLDETDRLPLPAQPCRT